MAKTQERDVKAEKADIDAEIFTTGVVHELLVKEGEKVPVGTVLATILEEGVPAGSPTRIRVSPLAKTVAATLGVDLATVFHHRREGERLAAAASAEIDDLLARPGSCQECREL